jgi:hypothetical protein
MTDYTWTGKAGDDSFDNPRNWTPSGFPLYAGTVTVGGESDVSVNDIYVFNNLIIEPNSEIVLNKGSAILVNNVTTIQADGILEIGPGSTYNSQSILVVNGVLDLQGILGGNGIISGTGMVLCTDGQNLVPWNPTGDSSILYELHGNATLRFNSMPPAASSFEFSEGNNTLIIPDYVGKVFSKIWGLSTGDVIQFPDGLITSVTEAKNADGSYELTLHGGNYDPVTLESVKVDAGETIELTHSWIGQSELIVKDDEPGKPVCCFARGTVLSTMTDAGWRDVAVEDLKIGDVMVCIIDGFLPVQSPIRWIGVQTIKADADPFRYAPVLIKREALSKSIPEVDVALSPDHAVLVGNILIQAGAMVNGDSIIRQEITEDFQYYHIELEAGHMCMYASNMLVESFVDNVDRCVFDNWDERTAPASQVMEMQYPRAKSMRQIPMVIREQLGLPLTGGVQLPENYKPQLPELLSDQTTQRTIH